MDYTDKQRVVLPHGENAVAVPVYDIGYKIGPKDFGPDGRVLLRLGKKRGILTLKSE